MKYRNEAMARLTPQQARDHAHRVLSFLRAQAGRLLPPIEAGDYSKRNN